MATVSEPLLLVTGFGPFLEVENNPSGLLARALVADEGLAAELGAPVRGGELPVSIERSAPAFDALLAELAEGPRAILCLGVQREAWWRLERCARGRLTESALLRAPAANYMNAEQLEYFRQLLLEMQQELLRKADDTSEHLREHEVEPDPTDPDRYLTPDGPRKLERHTETIRVKGGEDESLEVVSTIWGPVIDRDHRGRRRALRWIAHDPDAVNLGLAGMERARDLDEALEAASRAGVPTQNCQIADRRGRVGWTPMGPLPRRQSSDQPRGQVNPSPQGHPSDPAQTGRSGWPTSTPTPSSKSCSRSSRRRSLPGS